MFGRKRGASYLAEKIIIKLFMSFKKIIKTSKFSTKKIKIIKIEVQSDWVIFPLYTKLQKYFFPIT